MLCSLLDFLVSNDGREAEMRGSRWLDTAEHIRQATAGLAAELPRVWE
jgi:hypothetical protein